MRIDNFLEDDRQLGYIITRGSSYYIDDTELRKKVFYSSLRSFAKVWPVGKSIRSN